MSWKTFGSMCVLSVVLCAARTVLVHGQVVAPMLPQGTGIILTDGTQDLKVHNRHHETHGLKIREAGDFLILQGSDDVRRNVNTDASNAEEHQVADIDIPGLEAGDLFYSVHGIFIRGGGVGGIPPEWGAAYNRGDNRLLLEVNGPGEDDNCINLGQNGAELTIQLVGGAIGSLHEVSLGFTGEGEIAFSANPITIAGPNGSVIITLSGAQVGQVEITGSTPNAWDGAVNAEVGCTVVIETTPKKICKGVQSFTVNLANESETGHYAVTWSGVAGTTSADGRSFTFNPSAVGEGVYTITAEAGGASDSVQMKVTTWQAAYAAEATVTVHPGVTAQDVKELAKLDNVEAAYTKMTNEIADAVRTLIGPQEEQKLEDKWKEENPGWFNFPDPRAAFLEWLDGKIEEAKQFVITTMEEEIQAAQDRLSDTIDTFASTAAVNINNTFAFDAHFTADYKYQCHEFDPGDPGWTPPVLSPPFVEGIGTEAHIGFSIELALQPAGVGIGKLPIAARVTVDMETEVDGFYRDPAPWQPTVQHPGPVTTDAQLKIKWATSVAYASEMLMQVGIKGLGWGNKAYPANGFTIEMNAEDTAEKILPWTP